MKAEDALWRAVCERMVLGYYSLDRGRTFIITPKGGGLTVSIPKADVSRWLEEQRRAPWESPKTS